MTTRTLSAEQVKTFMAFLMSKTAALTRLLEDEDAPIMARVRAFKQIPHVEMAVLRRLLVNTPGRKRIPSKLFALATLAFAQELELKKQRKLKVKPVKGEDTTNLLGII